MCSLFHFILFRCLPVDGIQCCCNHNYNECTNQETCMNFEHLCVDLQPFGNNSSCIFNFTDNIHSDNTDPKNKSHTIYKWYFIHTGCFVQYRKIRCA